ncbi:hypothetical protein EVAR_96196_1 [Eumeta japonica]|uniref:Uncharacterized protein n=1 Tax=Eumeta variegata TaxID=151549 RepID=A0A4C1VL50_EUMVA|nr:hypothetical protein EVAR_96196_1 [Eumeta japonica]
MLDIYTSSESHPNEGYVICFTTTTSDASRYTQTRDARLLRCGYSFPRNGVGRHSFLFNRKAINATRPLFTKPGKLTGPARAHDITPTDELVITNGGRRLRPRALRVFFYFCCARLSPI